jgi:Bacterial TSP3 repeat/Metallo-peptidase family M12B Reprolysin-like
MPFGNSLAKEKHASAGGCMSKAWVLIFVSFLLFGGIAFAVDSDGDGLSDSVEASLGSSPLHKDIFVEIDWFIVNGRSMKPRPGFVEFVQTIFAAAPVLNPDGTAGIRIHLELSQGIRTNQTVLGYSDSKLNYQWGQFDSYKALYFTPSKRGTHHYCLFIQDWGGFNGKATLSSGISRNGENFVAGASDLIVSLGSTGKNGWYNHPTPGRFKYTQAGTFAHELGHNLGLKHGGSDHIHYKPNFLSLMNYSFQTDGIPYTRLDGVRFRIFDYSRFYLPGLNENNLNETTGLGPFASDNFGFYGTTYYEEITPDHHEQVDIWNATRSVDWNHDGRISTSVRSEINADRKLTSLRSTLEWSRLVYTGGWIGASGLSEASALPSETKLMCLRPIDRPKQKISAADANVRYGTYADIFKK